MSDKDWLYGGPAFPGPYLDDKGKIEVIIKQKGMTLRDYFAAKAMQGFMSRELIDGFDEDVIAFRSYQIADAMLKARAK